MSVAIVINANPLLHMMCIYILWEEPTTTDIMGKYFVIDISNYTTLARNHKLLPSKVYPSKGGIHKLYIGLSACLGAR